MTYKRILFTEPNVAKLLDYELDDPGVGEVQVRLAVSSISSGTERANLVGEINVNSKKITTVAKFPRSGGYSSAGIIEKVGEGVTDFKVGDRVALCWSRHQEVLNMPAKNVYKLDENISFSDAALFNIATFPLAAIRKCRLEIGESAIVMGMGILGLCAIVLLKAAGAVPVIAVDPDPQKREKAIKFGADFAFDPFEDGFAKKVRAVTDGGAQVAIEVTGNGGALDGVLDCMARHGRVALLGCTRNSDFTIDYYHKVHGPGITLIGAHTDARPKFESSSGWWTQSDDINTLIKLTASGRIKLSEMIDEIHSPSKAPEIYTRLANEKIFPLVQFNWEML